MEIYCNECKTPHFRKKAPETPVLVCKKCKSQFLVPVEIWKNVKSYQESVKKVQGNLKKEQQKKQEELNEKFKKEERITSQKIEKLAYEYNVFESKTGAKKKGSVAMKLFRIVFSCYLLITITMTSIHVYMEYNKTKEFTLESIKQFGMVLAPGVAGSLWEVDEEQIEILLKSIHNMPGIHGIKIQEADGKVFGAIGTIQDEKGNLTRVKEEGSPAHDDEPSDFFSLYVLDTKLVYDDDGKKEELGTMVLYSGSDVIIDQVQGGIIRVGFNAILTTFALWLVFMLASKIILNRPLKTLANAARSINLNNLELYKKIEIKMKGHNEIKELGDTFNSMVDKLKEEKKYISKVTKAFEKFVPRQLLSRITEEGVEAVTLGKIQDQRVALLYSACRDSIQPWVLDSETQFKFYNDYLSCLEQSIEKHGGFVQNFYTEKITAVFDLHDNETEALYAIFSALSMQEAIVSFNEKAEGKGYPKRSIGIGIHSGEIRMGAVGSDSRMGMSLEGEASQVAIHLQSLSRFFQSQIVISKNVFSLLKAGHPFKTRELDLMPAGSPNEGEPIYEILNGEEDGDLSEKEKALPMYKKGLQSFRSRKWDEAIGHFRKCLKFCKEDITVQRYISTCEKFKLTPPPEDWDLTLGLYIKY